MLIKHYNSIVTLSDRVVALKYFLIPKSRIKFPSGFPPNNKIHLSFQWKKITYFQSCHFLAQVENVIFPLMVNSIVHSQNNFFFFLAVMWPAVLPQEQHQLPHHHLLHHSRRLKKKTCPNGKRTCWKDRKKKLKKETQHNLIQQQAAATAAGMLE